MFSRADLLSNCLVWRNNKKGILKMFFERFIESTPSKRRKGSFGVIFEEAALKYANLMLKVKISPEKYHSY